MISSIINQLRIILSPRQKYVCCLLLLAILVAAVLELCGIGLVLPVIAILTNDQPAAQNKYFAALYEFLSPSSNDNFLIMLCVIIGVVYIIKNAILLAVNYFQLSLGFDIGTTLSKKLFAHYMRSTYAYHLRNNSSKLIYNIVNAKQLGDYFVHPLVIASAEIIIVTIVLLALLIISPLAMLGMSFCSGLVLLIVYPPLKKLNRKIGQQKFDTENAELAFIRSSLEGIKEYKVHNAEPRLISRYDKIARKLKTVLTNLNAIGQVPRFGIETLVICLGLSLPVAFIAFGISTTEIITTVSLLLFALIRIMPSISRIHYNLGILNGRLPSIKAILDEYFACQHEQEISSDKPLEFRNSIALNNISYTYPGSDAAVIENFNLQIPKNSTTAFIGTTGSGKTTIIDLITGLLTPTSGAVLVDDVDINDNLSQWRRHIGYVPQSIYLLDASVLENVALGLGSEEISREQVEHCLRQAQIYDFINSLPGGLDTIIGEKGTRLSGGQKQRLGIARALYRNPELLILDEATSALDDQTEKAFIDALDNLKGKLTIIIIAHRLSTTDNCDTIINISSPEHS